MVPFGILIIIRHLLFRVPQKGIIIWTTTHMYMHSMLHCFYLGQSLARAAEFKVWVNVTGPLCFLECGFDLAAAKWTRFPSYYGGCRK